MSNYTAQDIEDAVKLFEEHNEALDNGDFEDTDEAWQTYWEGWMELNHLIINDEVVPVTSVEQNGGEGEGDYCYIVFQIGDQLFKKEGYYASYDGYYWDEGDVFEVEPWQVLTTVYKRKV